MLTQMQKAENKRILNMELHGAGFEALVNALHAKRGRPKFDLTLKDLLDLLAGRMADEILAGTEPGERL